MTAVIEPFALLVKALGRATAGDAACDRDTSIDEIAGLRPAHPDFQHLRQLARLQARSSPRACSPPSANNARASSSADDLQRYGGIAPVTERSGNSCWVHWRWQCPTFLRQTFVEWAALTIPRSFWAAPLSQATRAGIPPGRLSCARLQVDPHPLSLLADRQTYDEALYLRSLRQRGSSLLNFMAAEANATTP